MSKSKCVDIQDVIFQVFQGNEGSCIRFLVPVFPVSRFIVSGFPVSGLIVLVFLCQRETLRVNLLILPWIEEIRKLGLKRLLVLILTNDRLGILHGVIQPVFVFTPCLPVLYFFLLVFQSVPSSSSPASSSASASMLVPVASFLRTPRTHFSNFNECTL